MHFVNFLWYQISVNIGQPEPTCDHPNWIKSKVEYPERLDYKFDINVV